MATPLQNQVEADSAAAAAAEVAAAVARYTATRSPESIVISPAVLQGEDFVAGREYHIYVTAPARETAAVSVYARSAGTADAALIAHAVGAGGARATPTGNNTELIVKTECTNPAVPGFSSTHTFRRNVTQSTAAGFALMGGAVATTTLAVVALVALVALMIHRMAKL